MEGRKDIAKGKKGKGWSSSQSNAVAWLAVPCTVLEVAQHPHMPERGEMRQPNPGEAFIGSNAPSTTMGRALRPLTSNALLPHPLPCPHTRPHTWKRNLPECCVRPFDSSACAASW
eukprot:245061-Chlamydomonas_euryale.AAC.3